MDRAWLKSIISAGLTITLFAVLLVWLKPEVLLALSFQTDVDITVDEIVVSGLERPVQVIHAGDGSGRLFVVEQPGRIRIVRDGILLSTPFLDIVDRVKYGGERGLLSVAFPPGYASKSHFYVNYTRQPDGHTVVARYSLTADPDVADATSEQVILTVSQPYENHNGGQLAFGPADGFLYVGMGDGGSGGDPQNYAQNTGSLLGKMLRIDVESGRDSYTIPASNPYTGISGYREEIWAVGLRNPWRFSFDRDTGDLYIGDVGQNEWEEISYQAAGTAGGLNFGWRCKEGAHIFDVSSAPCDDPSFLAELTDPVAEYGHDEGLSITGGGVYRGALYPGLTGRYFYADFVEGKVWSLYKTSSGPDAWSSPELELDTDLSISAFGEDEAGEMYVVDWAGGTVRRLADAAGPSPSEESTSRDDAGADHDDVTVSEEEEGAAPNGADVDYDDVTVSAEGTSHDSTVPDYDGIYMPLILKPWD
jgi:glucose/arabinose dehydrogenase